MIRRRVRSVLSIFLAASAAALMMTLVPASAGVASVSAAATSSWPQFARVPTHLNDAPAETGFSQDDVAGLHVAWTAPFGTFASGQGGAAVVDGVAYIGGSDGVLSAFSLSRCSAGRCPQPLWRGVTGGGIFGTPAVSGGLVLVGSSDHFLYAFPAAGCGQPTCAPRWRGQLVDASLGSVTVSDSVAYLGDFGGRLYAFSVAGCGAPTCSPRWTGRGGDNLEFNTAPTVAGGHVYVGALFNTPEDASGQMLVFAAAGCGRATCSPQWTADLLGQVDGGMSPIVSGSTVFAGSGTRFSDVPNGPLHLFAFKADGCGGPVCKPIRSYATGDSDLTGGLALANGVLYVGSQSTPDPNTVGVFMAFPAAGCGAKVCQPLWTAVNFASGFESPPVAVGDLVFVAKGPASGFPVDEAVLSYPANGCRAVTCLPLSFTQVGSQQFYLGSPIAVAEHTLFVPTEASDGGADTLVALKIASRWP